MQFREVARFLLEAGKWGLDHFFAPVLTAILLLVWGPNVVEQNALRNPTCENTEGAIPIPQNRVSVTGSDAQTPRDDETDADWKLTNLVDGNTHTAWVPLDADLAANSESRPHATFNFHRRNSDEPWPIDLALVCVVNGYQVSEVGYIRANRARTIEVRTDDDEDARTIVLDSVSEAEIQNPQTVDVRKGDVTELRITIVDTYAGRSVWDPANGRNQDPTGHTAIAEVLFFRKDPDLPPWYLFWWPFD